MQVAVDVYLMGGKITGDELIPTRAPIGDDQFIALALVSAASTCHMADEDISMTFSVLTTGKRTDSRVAIARAVI